MKSIKTTIAGWLLFCMVPAAQSGEYRIFMDDQGRAIEAKVVSYDPVKGNVQVERLDGTRIWVPPSLFSDTDQTYIKSWVAAFRVLSEDTLRVSFNKDKVDSFKEGMKSTKVPARKGDVVCYEVTLKNRAKQPIQGLKIEYRYFVLTKGSGTKEDSMKKIPKMSMTVSRIDPSGSIAFKTKQIELEIFYARISVHDRYTGSFQGYEFNKLSEDELMGIWLKIYGPEVDGEPTVRDVCYPEDLMENVDWNDRADL